MNKKNNGRIVFLTSSPDGSWQTEDGTWITGPFTFRNGFLDQMRSVWKDPSNVLAITAFPDEDEKNDEMLQYYTRVLAASELPVAEIRMLDRRTAGHVKEWMADSDFVILGGGHVPTEHAFFEKLGLKELIRDFSGVIMGISAGTMNSAELVYAQPELEGEAVDPGYVKFFPGLGLTALNILPHYQMVKDYTLDGMRLFEEITFSDSYGHEFLVLEDGSYVRCDDNGEVLYGNAYRIADGVMEQICGEGEQLVLTGPKRKKQGI